MSDIVRELRARLRGLAPYDRQRFRRRLDGAAKIAQPRRRDEVLAKLEAEIAAAEQRIAARRTGAPAKITYPDDLPITVRREELLATIRDHQVVIVAGETGSGKSTQLPKMCLELGRGVTGLIGHTQPRRIAARSIAARIAEELKTTVGGLVGYTVRFSDQVGDATMVKLMTDGILLAEIHNDRRLRRYDTIILDEAHERSLNIDFLLGYLKELLPKRSDLKVIVTSATIDTARFAAHFDDAPVVEVSGRTYPVELRYRPLDDGVSADPRDQPQAISDAVVELSAEGPGDVLVFCSGEREIRDAADAIADLGLRHTETLPLFARLSAAEQQRVFAPHTGRRIVLATNVAETSLTVPGIRYVVDAGTARISRFSRRTKVQRLPIEPISQASASQRAGRCGRLGPGICIRLYAEDDFVSRPEFTEPEIQRTSLASVILQMAAIGLGDIESFPFLDPPDRRAIRDGIALLHELGAIDPDREGTDRWLTGLGRRLAKLPVDPRLGRMLLEAAGNGCLREATVIVAALSIQDPRERPEDREQQADQMHARFRDEHSDLMGWLRLWDYITGERRARTSAQFRRMCRDEYLNYKRLREWQDLYAQLRDASRELGLAFNRTPADPDMLHQSLLAGLLSHVGKKDPDGHEYRGARGTRFWINPGSTLFKRSPEWVMAADLVETTRLWARDVAPVQIEWIERIGAHMIKRTHSEPWWDAAQGAAVAKESVTIYGLPLATDRTVQYARFDPAVAREMFIRHALVADEWETPHAFAERNRAAYDAVLDIEARERRSDLLVRDDAVFAIFDARIPADVTTVRHFDRWWRDVKEKQPHLLDLTFDDLIDPDAAPPDEDAFPAVWSYGDLELPLEYEFDPDSPADGLVVDVPLAGLDRIDPSVFAWNVPGRRTELFETLIRALPKALRKQFVPIPETVALLEARLGPTAGHVGEAVRRLLNEIGTTPVPPDAMQLDALPDHLRPTFRVVGDDGEPVAEGRDLGALKSELVDAARATLDATSHEIERTGLTEWSIGELPRVVHVGGPTPAYPALVDEGDSVAVRLLATPGEQAEAMWDGTVRLLLLSLPSPHGLVAPLLDREAKLTLRSGPHASSEEWVEDCLAGAVRAVVADAGGPVWDAVAFDRLRDRVRDELAARVREVASTALEIAERHVSVQQRLAGRWDELAGAALDDVAAQLDQLIYPGFITTVGADRLPDVLRYLQAVERRLERLTEDPDRDEELMLRVQRLEAELDRLFELLPATPALHDVAWMLQELRVSFFAQSLGTRGKVSEKRIAQRLDEIALGGE